MTSIMVLRDLMLLVAPLARESGAALVEADLPESLMVRASRVLLRQALLSLLGRVIELHAGDTLQVGAREGERVLLWLSPQQQLAAAQEPDALIASEILETLGAQTGYVRTPTGRPQYQLWLQPAPLQTVLVIDDNASLQRLFRRYLTGLPYAVLGAQSAEQGLALAQERIPSIILLDIMMPRQDGWDLLHALRDRPALNQIPVVICSVLSQEPLARSLGVAGYLKKPVSQDELLRMVQSVLGGGTRQ
jgi:CheY-like chemotaxis protein